MKILIIFLLIAINSYSDGLSFNKSRQIVHDKKVISSISLENTMLQHYLLKNNQNLPFAKGSLGVLVYMVDGYNPSECYYPIYYDKSVYSIQNVYCKKLITDISKKKRNFVLTKSNCKIDLQKIREDDLHNLCRDDEKMHFSLNDNQTMHIGELQCVLKQNDQDMMFVDFDFTKCTKGI